MNLPFVVILRTVGVLSFGLLTLKTGLLPQTRSDAEWSPRLILKVVDTQTGNPIAARFSLVIDGVYHEPPWVGAHGLRFASVHVSSRQTKIVTYSRGTGPVDLPLTPKAKVVQVHVTKGLEYIPAVIERTLSADPLEIEVALTKWSPIQNEGWRSADAHLHYDRVDPSGDRDWFHALDGDGLAYGQFMTLQGGMVPGVWAKQYAYGKQGEGTDGERVLVPGEEYRDNLQGHIVLFGMTKLIQPMTTGHEVPENYPSFFDVLLDAKKGGGLVGAAHAATLGLRPTGIADAALGALDFWEIGNVGRWVLDQWYRLMNCGILLPPSAGTDLPNGPYREHWEPFFGAIRMYVKLDRARGSDAWNKAVKQGKVFVTSGPMIRFSVNGAGLGETVSLPAGGGEVVVEAELSGPQLESLEIVSAGQVVANSETQVEGPVASIKKIVIRKVLKIRESTWLAARGAGARIGVRRRSAVAHTAAIRVLVGKQPIRSVDDAAYFARHLSGQREFYRQKAVYAKEAHRERAIELFDKAIQVFQKH